MRPSAPLRPGARLLSFHRAIVRRHRVALLHPEAKIEVSGEAAGSVSVRMTERSGAPPAVAIHANSLPEDPKADLAGLVMTQSLPFVEPRFVDTYAKFERAAYRQAGR